MPLLDAVTINTGKHGRPRKPLQVLAADTGYDSKALRQRIRQRGIRPQLPKRVWKTRQLRGRPLTMDVPRFQVERTCAWCQKQYRRRVFRWERLAACFNTFLVIAIIHIWIQKLIVG